MHTQGLRQPVDSRLLVGAEELCKLLLLCQSEVRPSDSGQSSVVENVKEQPYPYINQGQAASFIWYD